MPTIKARKLSEGISQDTLLESEKVNKMTNEDCELSLTDSMKKSEQYKALEKIYSHQGSAIFLMQDIPSKNFYVLKVIEKQNLSFSKQLHQQFEKQFCKLNKSIFLQHIISIKEIQENTEHVMYLMQYGQGGDLNPHVLKAQNLKTRSQKINHLKEMKNIIWQIFRGLEEIHSLGYILRDLKPANVLQCEDGKIKICDFGLVIKKGEIDPSLCGTPQYMAPERLSERKKTLPVVQSVDYWSLGALTYELLTGSTPFSYNDDTDKILDQIYEGYVSFDDKYPSYCKHFIFNLLQPNPKKRLTLEQVKNHEFFHEIR